MNGPDIGPVEQRLAAVIKEERREAIGYTLVTVLCTPVFVIVAGLVALLIVGYVLNAAHYEIDAKGLYTGINLFLAYMLIFVLGRSNPPEGPRMFNGTWLAAAIVFILPLVLTYATDLSQRFPVPFAIVYGILCFLVLGLLGRVQIELPAPDDTNGGETFSSLILALSAFVAMSYGEVTRSSWLWFSPKPDELRIAAWILCKLSIEKTSPMEARPVSRRILNMLLCLKLVHMMDRKLQLTLKGHDLVTEAGEVQSAAKE